MKRKFTLNYLFATFFFTGYIKFAPGTWGTLAGLLLWLMLPISSIYIKLFLIIATFITGVLVSGTIERKGETIDPGYIVIDEVVGMWITLMFIPGALLHNLSQLEDNSIQLVMAFLLFRFFDISKLPPIKYCEKLTGGFGIMIDDVIAGLVAGAIIYLMNIFII